jgi:hypothetical protein
MKDEAGLPKSVGEGFSFILPALQGYTSGRAAQTSKRRLPDGLY